MISMLNSLVKVDQIVSHIDEAGVQAPTKTKNRYITMLISHLTK